ncbi:hypothetical protein IWW34DRAFT_147666 [Fusarium oxysporum f. sp. albedinis]|nr:hypothetical protein IWW34DRAFT_147666 [Fusarium oxysporum f. sp. albedinis]
MVLVPLPLSIIEPWVPRTKAIWAIFSRIQRTLGALSGGSWFVGSLYMQNFTTVEFIISTSSGFLGTLWQLDDSILGLSELNFC